jgi:hypothetical protein
MKSINYEAPRCVIFSAILSLPTHSTLFPTPPFYILPPGADSLLLILYVNSIRDFAVTFSWSMEVMQGELNMGLPIFSRPAVFCSTLPTESVYQARADLQGGGDKIKIPFGSESQPGNPG